MKKNTFKNWINLIKFRFIAHKHRVTSKGDCYIRYIINKYVNATTPDEYIEAYEEMITRREAEVKTIKSFEIFYIKKDGTYNEEAIHFLAANFALSMILISLREEDVKMYIDLITNENAKKVINMMAHPNKNI